MSKINHITEDNLVLIGLNEYARNLVSDSVVNEPQPHLVGGEYALYNYQLPTGEKLYETLQGFLIKGRNVIFLIALCDEEDKWVEPSLWKGVPINTRLTSKT